MKPSDSNRPEQERMIKNIVLGILVWGVALAVGAYIFRGEHDLRKPLIILFFVVGFLAFWGWLLWRRFGSRS
jgi:hypothetical protein